MKCKPCRNIMTKTDLQIYSSNGCTNSNFIPNFKVSKMGQVMPTKVNWLTQLTTCCHCCGDCIESRVSSFWGCNTGQFQQNVSNQCGTSNAVEGPWLSVSEGNCKVVCKLPDSHQREESLVSFTETIKARQNVNKRA